MVGLVFPPVVNVVEFQATVGEPFTGTVALVDDTLDRTAIGITADILWGDGTVSFGTGSGSNGSFTVSGSHTYALAGPYTVFVEVTDSNGLAGVGSHAEDVAAACYCPGTLIRTTCGDKQVEQLAIGDVLVTASGAARPIKWIGRRSFGGRFVTGRKDILPVCFKAGSLRDGLPRRDLWISPHHAMYFENENGGVLVEAKDLINGASIVQAAHVDEVEYFHIELDSHDVILAEGAPSESFVDDDSRGMFHNAGEYAALYPGDVMRPARYCAPRLDIGYEVEAIRRELAQNAGLLTAGQDAGELRGCIDVVSPGFIKGWAQNVCYPEAPVCLDIYAGGRLIGHTLANRYREDLERAGIARGRNAFEFAPRLGVILAADQVEVRRSLDGAALLLSANAVRLSAAA